MYGTWAYSRAEAGAGFLDERTPGWDRQIDLDTLALHSNDRCLLGQLYDSYHRGLKELAISNSEAEDFGFYVEGHDIYAMVENTSLPRHPLTVSYEELTDAWKDLLNSRREDGNVEASPEPRTLAAV